MTDPAAPDPRDPDPGPPADLVDRGPVETLAPSRTAMVLVGLVGLVVAVLVGLGALDVEGDGRVLDEDETLLTAGEHTLEAGPATLTAELPGDWVARERCPRWLQLSDADSDATTLHVVWLDAVPLPSDAERVELVTTPPDLPAWWREELDLQVTPAGEATLDGHAVQRFDLDTTEDARRRDGLVACGDVGGLAATGMFGPAARFDQQVAVIDLDGDVPLLLVAAAYVGGDLERAVDGLDAVLESGVVSVSEEPADEDRG